MVMNLVNCVLLYIVHAPGYASHTCMYLSKSSNLHTIKSIFETNVCCVCVTYIFSIITKNYTIFNNCVFSKEIERRKDVPCTVPPIELLLPTSKTKKAYLNIFNNNQFVYILSIWKYLRQKVAQTTTAKLYYLYI